MYKLKSTLALATILLVGPGLVTAESEGRGQGQGQGQGDRSRPGKPPQAAFDACASSSANATCSVQNREGNVMAGLCLNPPQQQRLVCVPDQHRQQRSQRERGSQEGSGR